MTVKDRQMKTIKDTKMKRILSILASAALCFFCCCPVLQGQIQRYSGGGDGSRENPYRLQSSSDLRVLARYVNEGGTTAGVYYEQVADVDLGGDYGVRWDPIGSSRMIGKTLESHRFDGYYDGKGHVVKYLFVTNEGEDNDLYSLGLFGCCGPDAYIANLALDSTCRIELHPVDMSGWDPSGWGQRLYVGSIAADGGNLVSCRNHADIVADIGCSGFEGLEGSAASLSVHIGALSFSTETISDCRNYGNVEADVRGAYDAMDETPIDAWFDIVICAMGGGRITNAVNYGDLPESSFAFYLAGYPAARFEYCGNQGDIRSDECDVFSLDGSFLYLDGICSFYGSYLYNTGSVPHFYGDDRPDTVRLSHLYNAGDAEANFPVDPMYPKFMEVDHALYTEGNSSFAEVRGFLPVSEAELKSPAALAMLNGDGSGPGFVLPESGTENAGYPVFGRCKVTVNYIEQERTSTCNLEVGSLVPVETELPGFLYEGCFSDSACTQPWDEKRNTVATDMELYVKHERIWTSLADTAFAAGDGTCGDPFRIASAAQLAMLAAMADSSEPVTQGRYYRLLGDIDLGGAYWVPVVGFAGDFDGDGFTISGLRTVESEMAGLFASMEGGRVANLVLDSTCRIAGSDYAGSIVGNGRGMIENCHSSAHVESDGRAGGLAGEFRVESRDGGPDCVRLCSFAGSVEGTYQVGGLFGALYWGETRRKVLAYCYNTGTVKQKGWGAADAGGLAGKVALGFRENLHMEGVYSAGKVLDGYGYEYDVPYFNEIDNEFDSDGEVSFSRCYFLGYDYSGVGESVSSDELASAVMPSRLNPARSAAIYIYDAEGWNKGFPVINPGRVEVRFDNEGGLPVESRRFYACKPWGDQDFPVPELSEAYRGQCLSGDVRFRFWSERRSADPLPMAVDTFPAMDDMDLYSIWEVRTRFHASEISNIGLPDSYLVLGVPYLDHGLPSLQSDLASFHSWSLDSAGGKALQPADLVDSSRVLYPRWQFDVYFNAMGGHGIGGGTRDTGEGLWHSPFIGGIPYLESENQGLPIAGKDGYELGGWYSDPVYSGLKAESDIVPLKLHDTLYASWAGLVWVDFETGGIGAPERSRQYYPSVRYREDAYDEYNNGLPVRGADEGCYFMHWVDSGGNEVDGMDYVPACRHTLSALYACPVRVRFDARGGNEVAAGTYYTHVAWQGRYGMCQNPGLPTVSRDGFQFGGWFRDQACSEAVDEGDPVREEDSVLFAKWEGTVTVAFEVGGGEPVEARRYYTGFAYRDASVGNPGLPDAVKDGAVFEGWYSGPGFEEKVSETSLVTAGLTVLHARFGEKVSVSFECNGGEKLPDCEYYSCFAYREGKVGNPGLPTPSLSNEEDSLAFSTWCSDAGLENPVDESSIVDAAVDVLYARWEPAYQRVRFETFGDEGVADRVYRIGWNYASGPNPGLPVMADRENSTFLGWYADAGYVSEVTDGSSVMAGVPVLYARWSSHVEIHFETFGGTAIEPRTYETGLPFRQSGSLPADPEKGDALFLGWFADPGYVTEVDNDDDVAETMSRLYAKWGEKVNLVFVDYNNPDKMLVREEYYHNLAYGESPNKGLSSPRPAAAPWVFEGWHSSIRKMDSPVGDDSLVPMRSHVLHARWCVRVRFETFGGSVVPSRLYSPAIPYGEEPNEGLPASAYRPGYRFSGWHFDSACRIPVSGEAVVKDVPHVLYAGWEAIPATLVEVTFCVNGGEEIAPAVYQADGLPYGRQPNPGLPVPVRDGYYFVSWHSDAGLAHRVSDSTVVPQADHRLYAGWSENPVRKVRVSFEENGGEPVADREYQSGGLAYGEAPNTGLPVAMREGYYFAGWCSDAGLGTFVSDATLVPESDHVLYAVWTDEPVEWVRVVFETNGGEALPDRDYRADGLAYGEAPNPGLPLARKEGCDFIGWYADAGLAHRVSDSTVVPQADHRLYAGWEKDVGNDVSADACVLKVWPNPVRDILHWSFGGQVDSWQIWDGKGRKRMEMDGRHRQAEVDGLEDAWFSLLGIRSGKVVARMSFVKS